MRFNGALATALCSTSLLLGYTRADDDEGEAVVSSVSDEIVEPSASSEIERPTFTVNPFTHFSFS